MENIGEVKEIIIYPLKSASGIKLNNAVVTKFGLAYSDDLRIVDR